MSESVDLNNSVEEKTSDESAVFVERWNKLISTSNWEKGRIIHEWRNALIDSNAHAGEYSDEEWSRIVGSVTPQHVGRLRRVYKRFFTSYESYEGLYWSHFYAASEWDDAELWLEGASQNSWSISQMRKQRWEANGGDPSEKPDAKDVVTAEVDEDFGDEAVDSLVASSVETIENLDKKSDAPGGSSTDAEHMPFDKEDVDTAEAGDGEEGLGDESEEVAEKAAPVRPFAEIPELPDDLADAFDSFKLAILRHKVAEWAEIERDDVLVVLDSLKQLVTAPSEA